MGLTHPGVIVHQLRAVAPTAAPHRRLFTRVLVTSPDHDQYFMCLLLSIATVFNHVCFPIFWQRLSNIRYLRVAAPQPQLPVPTVQK